MARPRTPTKVLEARGAFKKHPERKRDEQPESKGPLGSPSEFLNEMESKAWHELASIAPTGVFAEADRPTMELACRLLTESRIDWENFTAAKLARLEALLGKFGMSPSDRAKLSIEKPKDASAFSAFD